MSTKPRTSRNVRQSAVAPAGIAVYRAYHERQAPDLPPAGSARTTRLRTSRRPMSASYLPPSEEVRRFIGRFGKVSVLVVGDFILDRFINGVIERISPEAPIPVLHGKSATSALGGAGNVVANIVSLGGRAVPLAVLGDDHAGRMVVEKLAGLGVDTGGMALEPGRMTPSKSRYSALNQQVLRFDEEEIRPLEAPGRDALLSRFGPALEAAD